MSRLFNPFGSIQSRIFLASSLLTVLSIGVAIYLVGVRASREAESALLADLVATGTLVDQIRTTRAETFTMMARLIGDAPKLKAAVDTNDPPTVQNVADDYQGRIRAHLLVVTNRDGAVLARVGATSDEARRLAALPATHEALNGRETFELLPDRNGLLQLATVPIAIGVERPDVLGALNVGFLLDDVLAAELKSVTGADVAFGLDGRILASTLPEDLRDAAAALLARTPEPHTVLLGSEDFVALTRPLASGDQARTTAVAVILRSRADQTRFLREINTELSVTALLGVLLATLLSFAVARTITRPLAAITREMREVASTGDLTRKIAPGGGKRWQDEDARLLASTFNTLTESVARFQREASQRERLSALGRLSTVIAHEVRNPLMIIKAALRSLRHSAAESTAVREAVTDIDGEVVRLNRIVNEVLDYARPIKFEIGPADVNVLCRDSAAAVQVSPGPPVELDLDPAAPIVVTDAERVRQALINLIANARQAADAQERQAVAALAATGTGDVAHGAADSPVTVATRATDGHVVITIADHGRGIEPGDLPRIFDPYFTTKRGGTGLGLPIAKNIIEGLGGTLTVSSAPHRGTEIRVELPSSVTMNT
jgi:signal transduction histidine kinase